MSVKKFVDSKSLAIVILGNFNPTIFQPYWLAKKDLIKESEAEDTKVTIIHNELVNYDLGWAKIDVRTDRFEISSSSEPYFGLVRDLVMGIFIFLKETPVSAIGINFFYKLSLQTAERFYEFGNKIAPLSNWSFLNDGRLASIEILEKEREDKMPGHYRIKIESDDSRSFGVIVLMNSHLTLNVNNGKVNEVVRILENHWKDSVEKAESNMEIIWDTLKV